jgi:hypothetical protein
MEIALFTITAVIVINWTLNLIGATFGGGANVPVPILHIWDISYGNTYISTPAIMYQAYFWGNYAGIFAK